MTAPAQVLPTTLGTCAREGRPWPGPTVDEGRLAVQAAFDGAVANLWEASWLNPTQRAAGTQSRPGPHHRGDPGMRLPAGQRYQAVVHGSNITRDMLSRLPRDYCL